MIIMFHIQLKYDYQSIISMENLLEAWKEFVKGKRRRTDVQLFERDLMSNIIALHHDLNTKIYEHSKYHAFKINDPKPRDIHKASVRDRLLHHAIYRVLYPFFDSKFIYDSYSCRLNKGTHRALDRFRTYARKVSVNHTRTIWVLKCDIRKFFASIDHEILIRILEQYIQDTDIIHLLHEIIGSFHTKGKQGIGLPLGNLTSQLLVNIYMNEFDHFIKRKLKITYYIRYADDFLILHQDKQYLETILSHVTDFLEKRLTLSLNPNKVSITTLASGIDFLGWVHFPHHRILRTTTKRRMFKKLDRYTSKESINSYLGLLSHGNTWKLSQEIRKRIYSKT